MAPPQVACRSTTRSNLTYINGDQDWAGVIPAILVSLAGRAFGVNIDHYLSAYGKQITTAVAQ